MMRYNDDDDDETMMRYDDDDVHRELNVGAI